MSSLRGDEHQDPIGCGDSHLEVIVQCDDIGVTNGHSLQYSNLVTDLRNQESAIVTKFKGSGYGKKRAPKGLG
jgi:hypothetical protein